MKLKILIPTYNESKTILPLLQTINLISIPNVDISVLIVDDGSPDKTADLVDSQNFPNIKVLRRAAKSGLGPSYLAGISEALKDKTITHIATMDADGSHQVIDLISLIDSAISSPNALIIGSRWVSGGKTTNWPTVRQYLSRGGTWYSSKALKLKIKDLTGGFKIYPTKTLNQIDLSAIKSNGYCFQIEITFAAIQVEPEFVEVPINFIERIAGVSKMSGAIVLEALAQVSTWGLALRGIGNADKLHYVK